MAHSPLEDPSWSELLQRLPAEFDLEATARALGAFQRARGVPDAATLLRLALIYGATNLSLRGTAAWARATGVASITDVALLGRLRSASTLLSELVSAILKTTPGTGAVGRRVRLIDATSFAAAGNPLAAWRVHADFDLGQCRFTGFELTDSHEAERLTRFDVEPGDILIGDRIYSQSAAALHQIVTAGGDFLVRRGGSSCRLLTSEGKAFDQKRALARIRYDKTAAFCVLVPVAGGAPMPARLVIHHMPQEHAQEARRRAESRCKVKRGAKDPDNAEFVMLMTTLPEQEFSTDRLLALYRLRWQIEIAFKRLKSLVKLDAIQAKDIRLARTAIYAKLIVALLIEDFLTELLESPVPFSDGPWTARRRRTRAVKRSGTKRVRRATAQSVVSSADRADLAGAAHCPLWLDHLGGTCAPASWPRSTPRGEFAPDDKNSLRAPVQGSAKVVAARVFEEGATMNTERRWYTGVDWASASHHVYLTDDAGTKLGERIFQHGGEGLAEMAAWIIGTAGETHAGQIHVAIEVPHGPVVEALIERGFNVYAINPKQLDRFRDRFTMAGAKDDSRDAETMASALRTDPRCFRPLAAMNPVVIELREWSRIAEDLGAERIRLTNRMREQFWRYFPAFLELETDLAAPWLLELWEAVPTPEKAKRVREATIARLLKKNRIRRHAAADVLTMLRAEPMTVADGTITAARAHIVSLIARIRLLNRQIDEAHRHLDRLTADLASAQETEPGQVKQHDAEILASLPGVGRIVLATLLAEAWDALQRRDHAALRSLTGVAPVTKRSGKSMAVTRRKACHRRLSNAVYHWARVAVQHDRASRAKYAVLRGRGHSHGRALRSVADRLLNVACAMLKTGTMFNASLVAQNAH